MIMIIIIMIMTVMMVMIMAMIMVMMTVVMEITIVLMIMIMLMTKIMIMTFTMITMNAIQTSIVIWSLHIQNLLCECSFSSIFIQHLVSKARSPSITNHASLNFVAKQFVLSLLVHRHFGRQIHDHTRDQLMIHSK